MTQEAPRAAEPAAAASTIASALGGPGTKQVPDMTIADAAARSGLPLRDAERGMHALLADYRGHLRVTSEGELVFRFPHGLTKPWVTRTRLREAGDRIGRALLGVARFVVRAWIAIVLVGYVLIFVALLIALAFARSDSRDSRGGGVGMGLVGGAFRVLAEAMFWMFHPFSPFSYGYYGQPYGGAAWASPARGRARAPEEPRVPFYERVNRFFFGPEEPPPDPLAMQKKVLAEIRAQKGRVGLSDVMRVTGLSRDEADPLMARLMLDYDGTVEVSEEGGIAYRFAEIRKTAADPHAGAQARPAPAWAEEKGLAPFTGNSVGTNLLIALLNGFNLLASWWFFANDMTIERIGAILSRVPLDKLPPAGTAWALGLVPLVFSIALFAVPLARAAWRPIKARRAAREKGRQAVLRAVLERARRRGGVTEEELASAWQDAAGSAPDPRALTREVVALGGDVDLENVEKGVRFRFPELEAEARAVEAEREAAAEEEAKVGPVIFSSES